MGLKQDIVIVSQFGNKNPGTYIRSYTSRKNDKYNEKIPATEPLELNPYITKYVSRVSAVEQLKSNAVSDNEVVLKDKDKSKKSGVMFGNRGISYDRETVEHAAYVSQKAADEGHTVIQPVISFSHEYLKKQGIIPEDLEEVTEKGGYYGQVDQLKLRQALTEMMNKMHQGMGFDKPEWTGVIQFDTTNLHAHMTSIETGTPPKKRLMYAQTDERHEQPEMKWLSDDRNDDYVIRENTDGFLEYYRDNEKVAEQVATQRGTPKTYHVNRKTSFKIEQERGKIGSKVQAGMRDTLDRSLSRTRDMKPLTKDITDQRKLTKQLTKNNMYYNQETIEKIQALLIALPDNQKMWRARSRAKSMQRPHELVNSIVDDVWTKYSDSVNLDEFESAVSNYIDARQNDEGFGAEYGSELKTNAYNRLREETINSIYTDMKSIKKKDKTIKQPKQSIKAASTEALKNTIADQFEREPNQYDAYVRVEYKSRDYKKRFYDAKDEAFNAQREIKRYDRFKKAGKVDKDSAVIRDYYEQEYYHEIGIVDKYDYLLNGKKSRVSKDRFNEVKGTDLVNMLYDYGPNDDRSVPTQIAAEYQKQSEARSKAYRKMMAYLAQTGQTEMYEKLKSGMEAVDMEAAISKQIHSELEIPTPTRNGFDSIETRRTIDTFKGRAVLNNTLKNIERETSFIRNDYDDYQPKYKNTKKQDKVINWDRVKSERDVKDTHDAERNYWQFKRMQFEQYLRDEKRREEEEKYNVKNFNIEQTEPIQNNTENEKQQDEPSKDVKTDDKEVEL